MLVFTYDDGHDDDYTKLYQGAHRPEGAPACTAVVTNRIGIDDFLSGEQLREMQDEGGWGVLSHTHRHRWLAPVDLTRDARAGDTRLYTETWQHGKLSGDPIEVTDGARSEVVRVAGADRDVPFVELREPLQNDYRVADGAYERYDPSFVDATFAESRQTLRRAFGPGAGNHLVLPYSQYGPSTRGLVGEHFVGVTDAGSHAAYDVKGLNPVDRIELPNLSREYFSERRMTDAQLGAWLDELAARDALGILGSHSWDETLPVERVRWTIRQARARGIDIVTLSEALSRLGLMTGESAPSTTETKTPETTTTRTTGTTETTTGTPETTETTTPETTAGSSSPATVTSEPTTSPETPASEEEDTKPDDDGSDGRGASGGGGGGVDVSQEGGLGIRNVDVANTTLLVGDEVLVTVTVSNTDVIPRSRTFELTLGGTALDAERVFADSGEERTFELAGRVTSPGEYELAVGAQTTTVLVEGRDDPTSQVTTELTPTPTTVRPSPSATTERVAEAGLQDATEPGTASDERSITTRDGDALSLPLEILAVVVGLGSAAAYLFSRRGGDGPEE